MDGTNLTNDTLTLGREGSTTNIAADMLVVNNIGVGASNTLSIANNINVSVGLPTTAISFTQSTVVCAYTRIAYGAGKFVIAGDSVSTKSFYSTNGTIWTACQGTILGTAIRSLVYTNDRFMIVNEDNPTRVFTSMDGFYWDQVNITSAPIIGIFNTGYGNGSVFGVQANGSQISISNNVGAAWTNITIPGSLAFFGTGFGVMTSGTNVFLVVGTNVIRRNVSTLTTVANWTAPTTPPTNGLWRYVAFGNDTFMVTSFDTVGLLTISRDGGITWTTPISFGVGLRGIIYVENEWYIASEDGFIMISKDNGYTWEKKSTGINTFFFAYGNSLLVTTSVSNIQNVITIKKKRNDGTNVTADTLTLGNDGTTTVLSETTLGTPLTPSYTYPIIDSSKIGFFVQPTITWTASADTVIGTSPILPRGNYIMTFSIMTTGTYVPNYVSFSGTAVGIVLNYRIPWVSSSSGWPIVNGTYTFSVTTAGTINLVNRAANTQTFGDGIWNIMRIS
jgi:hypothetical protein